MERSLLPTMQRDAKNCNVQLHLWEEEDIDEEM